MKVVSIVGMAGAGKSEVAAVFEEKGFTRIRFGDVTDEEMGGGAWSQMRKTSAISENGSGESMGWQLMPD